MFRGVSVASRFVFVGMLALALWITAEYVHATGCNMACSPTPSNTCTGVDQDCTTSFCSNCDEIAQDIIFYNVAVHSPDAGSSTIHTVAVDCMDTAPCGYGAATSNEACWFGSCVWTPFTSCSLCAITGAGTVHTFPHCIDDGCSEGG